jgi:hypothetical protein
MPDSLEGINLNFLLSSLEQLVKKKINKKKYTLPFLKLNFINFLINLIKFN